MGGETLEYLESLFDAGDFEELENNGECLSDWIVVDTKIGDKMNIDEKIEEAAKLRKEMENETVVLKTELMKIGWQVENIEKPFLEKINKLEEEIKAGVLESGKKYKHDLAEVSYRKGYVRASWDTKKLDGYATAHPEIKEFKKETEVKPSSSIKWL